MKKVKRMIKKVAICMFVLVLATTFSIPTSFMTKKVSAADNPKKPKATNINYYPDNNVDKKERTGIKSFTLEPYTYYNMTKDSKINPSGDSTMNLDNATIKRIAENQIFPKWGVIAEEIFRNQANQFVTIEGSGMMTSNTSSKESFDRHFATGKEGISGYDYDWSLSDLSSELSNPDYGHKGDLCWDEVRREGIFQISSLADARRMMGRSLRNCSDDDDVSIDDFLGNNKQKTDSKYRLPDLANDNKTDGFCNVVTCVNRAGASGDYDYVTFGLAVYDFDLTPIAAEDLKYIEAADKYENGEKILMGEEGNVTDKEGIKFTEDRVDGATTYLKNATDHEATQTTGLENSTSEEVSLSQESSFEWGMEQTLGTEWGLGGWNGVNCMFPRCSLTVSNSWHEVWTTTKSQSQSKSVSKTKSVSTEVTLPAHTTAKISQSLNNKNTIENYQQPVGLNYKVAVFAMSGDYFNGWGGGIDNSRYDKQWMSVLFDGSDDYAVSGSDAIGSLYNRAVINKDIKRYDGAKGKYNVWCDKHAWEKSEKIGWGAIADSIANDNRASHNIPSAATGTKSTLNDLSTEIPLMEKAMNLSSQQKNITSSVDEVIPLYLLDSVSLKDSGKHYEVKPAEKVYLDGIELEGADRGNVGFHGFQSSWGSWKLLDDDKNIIEDGSSKDEDGVKNGQVKYKLLTLHTDKDLDSQWIKVADSASFGENPNEQLIKWTIDEDAKIVSNENLINKEPCMTPEQIARVSVPFINIIPKDESRNVKSVELSGTYKGIYTDEICLDSELKAKAIDEAGRTKRIQLRWEGNGDDGIDVDESGLVKFSKPGTYKVRAYCTDDTGNSIFSSWAEVIATEKSKLTTINFTKPADLDEDDYTITKKNQSKQFDLDSYISMFDQYGEKWTGAKPTIEYTVTDNDGKAVETASVDHNNILTVTDQGTYKIKAKAVNEDGEDLGYSIDTVKLKIFEDEWLNSIEFEEPSLSKNALQLKSKNDVIEVGDLRNQIRYINQYGEEWEGKKPNISFSLVDDTTDAEIKGDSFFAYKPGVYKIQANASGYNIEPITIRVEEDPYLVIKTRNPETQYLTQEEDSVSVDLERFVDFTTQFDGKYDVDKPELNFELEDVSNGSEIVTEKVKDEETGEISNVIRFKASSPGEYEVIVTPKKASAYNDDIDNICITVEKKRMVSCVSLELTPLEEERDRRTLNDSGECTIDNLKQYLVYYDQFYEKFSAKDLDLLGDKVPKVTGYTVTPSDKNASIVKGDDGKYSFVAKEKGAYMITPTCENEEEIVVFGSVINIIDKNTSAEIDEAISEGSNKLSEAYDAYSAGKISEAQLDELVSAVNQFNEEVNNSQYTEDINAAKEKLLNIFEQIMPKPVETTTVEPTTVAPTTKTTTKAQTTTQKAQAKKPGKVTIVKLKKKKSAKKLKVTLKKVSGAQGYQVSAYKTKSNAKKNKKALVNKYFTQTSVKFTLKSKKLKNKKTLYVKARAYKLNGKNKLFGDWSK
ncbi:MAG: hypothetical protein K6E58_01560, partial [Eubacterium sp.]|nr:hypothetical protein [Eubacterium sp.]